MGIGWTWGFLASFSNQPVLWWIFVVINSFQGVFMAFSFLRSSNIRNIIKRATDRSTSTADTAPST